MECFGPFTVVNGAVWPILDVEPTTYRFRVLNGSNARTFRLVLLRDGQADHGASPRSAPKAACWRRRSPSGAGPRPGLGRAGRPARRLLGSCARHGADLMNTPRAVRGTAADPADGWHAGSRGTPAVSGGDAASASVRRVPLPPPAIRRAGHGLPRTHAGVAGAPCGPSRSSSWSPRRRARRRC